MSVTRNEERAIDSLQMAFDNLPKSLKVYVLDANVIVCKIGEPIEMCAEHVGTAFPTNMLPDVHCFPNYGAPNNACTKTSLSAGANTGANVKSTQAKEGSENNPAGL